MVFAKRSMMVNERNMKKLKTILEIVTIKYDNGAASIGDITSIKANVANSMTKLVKVNSKSVTKGCLAIIHWLELSVISQFIAKELIEPVDIKLLGPVAVALLGSTTAALECNKLKVVVVSLYCFINFGDS